MTIEDELPENANDTDVPLGDDPASSVLDSPGNAERLLESISTPPSERLVFETMEELKKALGL
jgi:hypothetical protein